VPCFVDDVEVLRDFFDKRDKDEAFEGFGEVAAKDYVLW
jgi:hypothetical protein